MADAKMQIDIPGVDFRDMARQAIAERLTEALVGHDDMIRTIVVAALDQKVDTEGKRNSYAHHNTTPFIEWMAHDLIRKATLSVLQERVEKMRPRIEAAVEAALTRSTKAAARAMTDSFIERAKNPYGLTCDVVLKVRETAR